MSTIKPLTEGMDLPDREELAHMAKIDSYVIPAVREMFTNPSLLLLAYLQEEIKESTCCHIEPHEIRSALMGIAEHLED